MKQLLAVALFFCLAFSPAFSQNARYVDVPPGKNVLAYAGAAFLYAYPEFRTGTIFYKNGKTKEAAVNYHSLFGEIQTIHNNDTAALDDDRIESVQVGEDNFVRGSFSPSVVSRYFFKIEKDYGKIRLVSRKQVALVKRTPLSTDSTRFNLDFSYLSNGYFLKNVAPVDTLHLAFFELFYLLNVKNEILSVHRSALIDLYPHRGKAILEYLRRRTVYPYDKEAVLALLNFVTEKVYTP